MRSVLFLLVSLAMPVSAAPAPNRPISLLKEVEEICVKTRVEPGRIAEAASARGYRTVRGGEYTLDAKGQSARIRVVRAPGRNDFPELGPLDVMDCAVLVQPGREQDLADVLQWFGLGKAAPKQHYSFIIEAGPNGDQRVLNGNMLGQVRALRRDSLRLVVLERLNGAVGIHYMSARPAPED